MRIESATNNHLNLRTKLSEWQRFLSSQRKKQIHSTVESIFAQIKKV